MTRRMVLLAMITAAFTGARAQAQDKYPLKLKVAGKGDSYLFKHTDSTTTTTKVVDDQGNSQKEKTSTNSKSFTYVESILQKAPGQAFGTAIRRGYQKAQVTRNEKTRTLPMEGKAVLIDRKDERFSYRLESGGDVTAEDIVELDLDFNKRAFNFLDQDILPKQAVRVQESWSIDPATALQGMGKDESKRFDLDKAKVTAKLVRAYPKNKSQYGVVEFQFELPLTIGVMAGKGLKTLGGKMVVKGTFDGCIDGSSFERSIKATLTYEARGSQEDNLMRVLVVTVISGTLEQTWEDMGKR